ncbi:exported hypothetical protein [Candidatus Zixiibacteriota bacterium]|nr:exported hypothetical protein [candidate division Zixibacteria bacterium]
MQIRIRNLRAVALLLMLAYAQAVFLPTWTLAQAPPCNYDKKNPSLDNARKNFKTLNYKCAEAELNDLLKNESLSLEEKSNAHILLAAVYYAMLKDDSEKKSMVMDQFKAAFKAYRDWKGELDIKSPEFVEMMKEAQVQVDSEAPVPDTTGQKAVAVDTTQKQVAPVAAPAKSGSKAWYKQWWAIALGVGLVAGGIALAAGGGSGGETPPTPLDTLPTFPDPPGK